MTKASSKHHIDLGLVYVDLQRFDTAAQYFNAVLERAQRMSVSPELAGSAEMHLGICYFWRRDYTAAIRHYQQSLDIFMAANLRLRMAYAHHNLAEAYYTRFALSRNMADESLGDAHATASRRVIHSRRELGLRADCARIEARHSQRRGG